MPKRTDIESILLIGAGPIVIGQACEFDYSGAQACKALREEGYRVVLVNSNPATIMTDPEMADATYVEPITAEYVSKVIVEERPDAILPTLGGQVSPWLFSWGAAIRGVVRLPAAHGADGSGPSRGAPGARHGTTRPSHAEGAREPPSNDEAPGTG